MATSPGDTGPIPELPSRLSVVVPVYKGEKTLEALTAEMVPLTRPQTSPAGHPFVVTELVFVWDGAVDGSAGVIRSLAERHKFVQPIWLSRNYGQHAATLAGMAATSGDWVATLDEDGQHNPADLGRMLDAALAEGVLLVYARPTNPPPHGAVRNLLSRGAKGVVAFLIGDGRIVHFQSYRLVNGEIARSLAAYCGQGVYLDVALAWVVDRFSTCPLELRGDSTRASGYNLPRLFGHFWRLVLTAGTRPLRMIAALGGFSMLVALGLAVKAFYEKLINQVPVAGWTSLIVVLSFFSGVTLFSLSIIAEYLGLSLNMAMGKPTYLSVSRPAQKPGSAP